MTKPTKRLTNIHSDRKTPNTVDIERFLDDVRSLDNTIGSYQQHLILADGFTYSIELTNGTIRIYGDELQDKKALPQERFRDIAARFRARKTSLF